MKYFDIVRTPTHQTPLPREEQFLVDFSQSVGLELVNY